MNPKSRLTQIAAALVLLAAGLAVGAALAAPTPVAPATAAAGASRAAVYQEIEQMFGLVPTMFKLLPDSTLELEWRLFKASQFDPGPIPNKYRELIGIGLSAIAKCQYCVAYHTEVARLNGATEAEIEDAVHYAKSSAGWSTYLNGMQVDLDLFKREVRSAVAYARAQAEKADQAARAGRVKGQ